MDTYPPSDSRRDVAPQLSRHCRASFPPKSLDHGPELLGIVGAQSGKQLVRMKDEPTRFGVALVMDSGHPRWQRSRAVDDCREHLGHRQLYEKATNSLGHALDPKPRARGGSRDQLVQRSKDRTVEHGTGAEVDDRAATGVEGPEAFFAKGGAVLPLGMA